jgi:hypothetical protein
LLDPEWFTFTPVVGWEECSERDQFSGRLNSTSLVNFYTCAVQVINNI